MTMPDRFFTYKRGHANEAYGSTASIVWDVYREGWYLGQVVRQKYQYGAGYTWQAYFVGWRSWPERRRMDAADALWMARGAWEKGPTPADEKEDERPPAKTR
jgi:hypothetical protein